MYESAKQKPQCCEMQSKDERREHAGAHTDAEGRVPG
jgi:hypothetical protein